MHMTQHSAWLHCPTDTNFLHVLSVQGCINLIIKEVEGPWIAFLDGKDTSATSVFCPPESCSSDFISLWRPMKETWGWKGGQ